jgi:uncharacterized protein YceK
MKKIAFTLILVLAFALITCGCTSITQPAAPLPPVTTVTAAPVTPDLMGTWTGTMEGYRNGKGFEDFSNSSLSMTVTEQNGRIFAGRFTFRVNGGEFIVPMAGVIGSDSRSLSLVEDGNGYTFGEITGKNEIQLTHLDDAEPFSVALDTLKRA